MSAKGPQKDPGRPGDGWHVSVVGAFDRFNYGDVLFARLSRHLFERSAPGASLSFHGLRAADLTSEGGVATRPLRDVYRAPQEGRRHLVFVAGGAVLGPSWAQMAEHLTSHDLSRWMGRLHRRIGYPAASELWRRAMRCPNRQPWTIDPDDLPQGRAGAPAVAYNAVGGIGTPGVSSAQVAWQRSALAKAAWLTVRDGLTAEGVAQRGLPRPEVVPDSAVVMTRIVEASARADAAARIRSLAGLEAGAPYLCMQIGSKRLRGHEEAFITALQRIHERTRQPILSFAIGRAAGHEDEAASERLADALGRPDWLRIVRPDASAPLTVDEILTLIADSSAYMGSSLHGYITAFAHAVPRVGLMPEIRKIAGFRDDWDLAGMPVGLLPEDLPGALETAMGHAPDEMHRVAAAAAAAYDDSFARMLAKIGIREG